MESDPSSSRAPEGDDAALHALVERYGPSVFAYCAAVCPPELVARAAAESFARYRAAVHDALDPAAVDHEAVLLLSTRHAASSMARTTPPAPGRGRRNTCPLVPTLLAARESGALGAEDRARLTRHLARCEGCREVEAGFRGAERSFREPPAIEIDDASREVVLAALAAAVPVGAGPVTAPDGEAPADAGPQDAGDLVYAAHGEAVTAEHEPQLRTVASFPSPQTDIPEVASGTRKRFGAKRPQRAALDGRMLLPIGVVAAAAVAALAAAGVFGGDEAAPPVERTGVVAREVDPPVTTPLPVTVPEPRTVPERKPSEEEPEPGATTPVVPSQPVEPQPDADPGAQGKAPQGDAEAQSGAERQSAPAPDAGSGGEGTVFQADPAATPPPG